MAGQTAIRATISRLIGLPAQEFVLTLASVRPRIRFNYVYESRTLVQPCRSGSRIGVSWNEGVGWRTVLMVVAPQFVA
jgi:hypothetical protein